MIMSLLSPPGGEAWRLHRGLCRMQLSEYGVYFDDQEYLPMLHADFDMLVEAPSKDLGLLLATGKRRNGALQR